MEQRAIAQGDHVAMKLLARHERCFRAGDEARGQAARVQLHHAFTRELEAIRHRKRSCQRVAPGTHTDSSRTLFWLERVDQLGRGGDRDLWSLVGRSLVRCKQRQGDRH